MKSSPLLQCGHVGVFSKSFHRIQRRKYSSKRASTYHPDTSCVRDQDATTVEAANVKSLVSTKLKTTYMQLSPQQCKQR